MLTSFPGLRVAQGLGREVLAGGVGSRSTEGGLGRSGAAGSSLGGSRVVTSSGFRLVQQTIEYTTASPPPVRAARTDRRVLRETTSSVLLRYMILAPGD